MELEQFVDLLIAEKGIDSTDEDVRAQVKEDLLDRVENRIQAVILANLPEDKLEEFEKVLDDEDEDAIQAYLRENISGFDTKVAEELVAFKSTYLG